MPDVSAVQQQASANQLTIIFGIFATILGAVTIGVAIYQYWPRSMRRARRWCVEMQTPAGPMISRHLLQGTNAATDTPSNTDSATMLSVDIPTSPSIAYPPPTHTDSAHSDFQVFSHDKDIERQLA
ncbi:hypothetical protein LTR91_019693 [Friedmanniomyces endolithicus]|uniref:Uncharacterized protein n=1 Tax=Friedmanniomyces endolithicus TaxID=329885 RepID=A0AAN6K441_9PEZI|nr:hypothetical protein LTR94_015813 [Friedmanniomyces endolithicus]KAK0783043.1 hypothetical protein LTR38_013151 [Friedmanniomyces endolithicus]KAK0787798.1 hypothetical protein LTR75_012796 [Friedmanniomyces endolithicus]KAK0844839.1 hypothetical protein LTR03_007834 [Friedmanniomyces endolithicus]KAK0846836.1 hypothetical protein LTS02_014730 [Friedmanniomyces endolithicus]